MKYLILLIFIPLKMFSQKHDCIPLINKAFYNIPLDSNYSKMLTNIYSDSTRFQVIQDTPYYKIYVLNCKDKNPALDSVRIFITDCIFPQKKHKSINLGHQYTVQYFLSKSDTLNQHIIENWYEQYFDSLKQCINYYHENKHKNSKNTTTSFKMNNDDNIPIVIISKSDISSEKCYFIISVYNLNDYKPGRPYYINKESSKPINNEHLRNNNPLKLRIIY